MQDAVRATIKQTTEGIDRSSFMHGNRKGTTELQDVVRGSMRQYFNTQTYDGVLNRSNNNGYITVDKTISVPMQMRQLCNNDNYYHNIGSSNVINNNFANTNTFNLPITMKQMYMTDRIGGMNATSEHMVQQPYYDARYNVSKEITLTNREPTKTNINVIPFADQLGEIRYPNTNIINKVENRIGNVSMHNFRSNSYNLDVKDYPTYGDRIPLFNMRDENSYIQPSFYKGPYYGSALDYNNCNSLNPENECDQTRYERGDLTNMQMYNQMYDTSEPDMYSSEI